MALTSRSAVKTSPWSVTLCLDLICWSINLHILRFLLLFARSSKILLLSSKNSKLLQLYSESSKNLYTEIEVISVIGERLADIRKDHGDTRQTLADKLQVSKFTVSNWEQETDKNLQALWNFIGLSSRAFKHRPCLCEESVRNAFQRRPGFDEGI